MPGPRRTPRPRSHARAAPARPGRPLHAAIDNGLTGEVRLAPERRAAFLDDLRSALQDVLNRYGGSEGPAFRIALASYPKGDPA
jgi:hypothetical protein